MDDQMKEILCNLSVAHRDLAAGHRDLAAGHRDMAAGHRDLAAGHRDMAAGHRELALAVRLMAERRTAASPATTAHLDTPQHLNPGRVASPEASRVRSESLSWCTTMPSAVSETLTADESVSADAMTEAMKEFKMEETEEKEEEEEEEEPIPEGDPEMAKLDWNEFIKLKDAPAAIAADYLPELKRRYKLTERRTKATKKRLVDLHPAARSTAEDRQEHLGELLDKIKHGFDIIDENENRKIPSGHRAHLEARLLKSMNAKVDYVHRIIDKWEVIGEDRNAAYRERDCLRDEIRVLDLFYAEVEESFIRSFLEIKC